MNFVAVILCGGKGERFWPLSRDQNPKQFLKIKGEKSLMELTVERLMRVEGLEEIILISNERFMDRLEKMFPEATKIYEPVGKNTAPACAVSNEYLKRKYGDTIVGVFPSDHYIENEELFFSAIKEGKRLAKGGNIVTIGIKPTRPETGYGYIERGEPLSPKSYKVIKFHEKPDRETAEKYIKTGNFYWNAGIFLWSTTTFDEAVKSFLPEFYTILKEKDPGKDLKDIYNLAPEISVDYAIIEKAKNIAVVEGEFFWEDLGSFPSLERIWTKDESGNITIGTCVTLECKNSIFIQNGPIITGFGLDSFIVVSTPDVVLIIPKEYAQKVKDLRGKIKEQGLENIL